MSITISIATITERMVFFSGNSPCPIRRDTAAPGYVSGFTAGDARLLNNASSEASAIGLWAAGAGVGTVSGPVLADCCGWTPAPCVGVMGIDERCIGCCAGGNAVGAWISAAVACATGAVRNTGRCCSMAGATGCGATAGRIGAAGRGATAGALAGWICIFWPELISGRRIGAGFIPVIDVSRTIGLWLAMIGLLVLDAGALPGRITSNTARCGRGGRERLGRGGRLGFIGILYL